MESSSSLLVPLTRAARNFAASAQRAFAGPAQALGEQADELPQASKDLARAATQFLDATQETMRVARATAKPYQSQAARALANTQDRLHTLGQTFDSRIRRLGPGRRDNVITRHPFAATFVAFGIGYIAWRQWWRRRANGAARADEAAAAEEAQGSDEESLKAGDGRRGE